MTLSAEAIRGHFVTGLKILVASVVAIGLILYVSCGLWPPAANAGAAAAARRIAEPQPLDWYVLRDASGSADPRDYDSLEEAIREHLCLLAGDRLSCALFGSRTEPDPVPPPSDRLDPRPQPAPSWLAQTTDFALLFDKVREAIRDERAARAATHERHRADAVVLITDGVPDLSHGAAHCPPRRGELISPAIAGAFQKLIDRRGYPTPEPVEVRLILAGAPETCVERTKELWESRLAPLAERSGFRVIAASGVERVEAELFASLDRGPRESVSLLPLGDGERSKLDRGKTFAVKVEACSFVRGDRLRFEKAELREGGSRGQAARIQLHVLRDSLFDPFPFEPQNLMTLDLPSPAPGRLVGEPRRTSIHFLPAAGQEAAISPYSAYELSLTALGDHRTAVVPISLRLGLSREAELSLHGKERLRKLTVVAAGIALAFLIVAFGWVMTAGTGRPARAAKLHRFLEQMVVDQMGWWMAAALVLTPALAKGAYDIADSEVDACVTLCLAILLWVTEKLASRPTPKVFAFAVEFLVLPFFIHFLINHPH